MDVEILYHWSLSRLIAAVSKGLSDTKSLSASGFCDSSTNTAEVNTYASSTTSQRAWPVAGSTVMSSLQPCHVKTCGTTKAVRHSGLLSQSEHVPATTCTAKFWLFSVIFSPKIRSEPKISACPARSCGRMRIMHGKVSQNIRFSTQSRTTADLQ